MKYILKDIMKSILFALLIVFVFLFIFARSGVTEFGIFVILTIAIISTIIFCTYSIIDAIKENSKNI